MRIINYHDDKKYNYVTYENDFLFKIYPVKTTI